MSEPTEEELDGAINELQSFIDAPASRREIRLTSVTDQLAAKLRDMDVEERNQVIETLVENGELNEEEARDWIKRLIIPE